MSVDLYNNIEIKQSIDPVAMTTTTNGAAVDLHGAQSAAVEIYAGLWTDGTHTFEVQHSDASGSGFAAVAAADLQGSEPVIDGAADDNQIYRLGYQGTKRYLRVINTVSGATTGLVAAASVILAALRKKPAS